MTPSTTCLTDLPPELLDHVTTYLPTAQSLSNLGRTNKFLHTFIEKDAWQTFSRTQFPSLRPPQSLSSGESHKDVARTLTTLSRAWDRRAFLSRYIEPQGNILALPGEKKVERWKRPRGQTIGFMPKVDCFEEVGSIWKERREVLAFSAGAEVCVRERRIGCDGRGGVRDEDLKWMTYRPLSAFEGRDDVTSLHLLRPQPGEGGDERTVVELITGTANGDLQLLRLPNEPGTDVPRTYFITQGLPVRSSSLLQEHWKPALLAANLGDLRIGVYEVDPNRPKVVPTSQIDIRPPTPTSGHSRGYRTWSTSFLPSNHLAVGLGPSEEPVHIYTLTPTGLERDPLRKLALQTHLDRLDGQGTLGGKREISSIYPIVPLPSNSSAESQHDGNVFLTGAYDGLIRLHDLRSGRDVEKIYEDPTDSNAIYSLLPRGRETLVAGTSRHSLLKVFDMRMGAKCYSYLDAASTALSSNAGKANDVADIDRTCNVSGAEICKNWNLFLKPHSATYPGRGGGNNWARRSAESSIYSLASPSPSSPFLYAGVENAVVEMAFTSPTDAHPDPVFDFKPNAEGVRVKEVLNLAMYDQTAESLKLMTQRSLWDVFRAKNAKVPRVPDFEVRGVEGLDDRWRVGGS